MTRNLFIFIQICFNWIFHNLILYFVNCKFVQFSTTSTIEKLKSCCHCKWDHYPPPPPRWLNFYMFPSHVWWFLFLSSPDILYLNLCIHPCSHSLQNGSVCYISDMGEPSGAIFFNDIFSVVEFKRFNLNGLDSCWMKFAEG